MSNELEQRRNQLVEYWEKMEEYYKNKISSIESERDYIMRGIIEELSNIDQELTKEDVQSVRK